tara:strand:+ start:6127 stop:7131 length:1005 start_codon:yes stop_codon:yes gene_type:complete
MANEDTTCQVCGKTFDTIRGLHIHLKGHKITQAEYYCRHFPRLNKLTGEPLPFKNRSDYFNKDFANYDQLLKWCSTASIEEVKPYILEQLSRRIKEKELKFGPCHLEMAQKEMPPIELYKKIFGSYTWACEAAGVEPLYNKKVKEQFFVEDEKFNDLNIFIDTREQQPLTFKNSESVKLDFGDYTLGGDNYNYTFVDRKSEGDFLITFSSGFKRFQKEMDRVVQFDSFLYIVIESDLEQIKNNNDRLKAAIAINKNKAAKDRNPKMRQFAANLDYIYYNMRKLIRDYPRKCQFIFTGSREASERIIPRLLFFGKELWQADVQYFIEQNGISGKN